MKLKRVATMLSSRLLDHYLINKRSIYRAMLIPRGKH